MLEPIKVKAIEAAVRTLTVLGCKIKVITPDGVEFGELAVVNHQKKSGFGVHVNSFVSTGYREKIKALTIGDAESIAWPDAASIGNLRSAMGSLGSREFGKGSCMTDVDRAAGVVTILRVA